MKPTRPKVQVRRKPILQTLQELKAEAQVRTVYDLHFDGLSRGQALSLLETLKRNKDLPTQLRGIVNKLYAEVSPPPEQRATITPKRKREGDVGDQWRGLSFLEIASLRVVDLRRMLEDLGIHPTGSLENRFHQAADAVGATFRSQDLTLNFLQEAPMHALRLILAQLTGSTYADVYRAHKRDRDALIDSIDRNVAHYIPGVYTEGEEEDGEDI